MTSPAPGLPTAALAEVVQRKIPAPLFATLAGDHLKGLAGEGTAVALSGAMVLPLRDVLGLRPARETKGRQVTVGGREVQLTFHDVRHYLDLVARTANTAILEELFSPVTVLGGEDLERLRDTARGFINRHCFHDYLERARESRRRLLDRTSGATWHLLEAARLYLAGIHVLATGRLLAALTDLAEEHDALWIKPFLRRLHGRGAQAGLETDEVRLLGHELDRLEERLRTAHERSRLPDSVGSITMLDEFLVQLRLRELREA